MNTKHAWLTGCGIVITILTWIVIWHFWEDTSEEAFSIKSTWSANSVVNGPKYWLVQDSRVIPIEYIWTFYFTNLKPLTIMIYSSWVEQRDENGKWKKIGLPYGNEGKLYSGMDRKDASEALVTTFESASANKNIAANETIHGWIYFPTMPSFPLRFCITDATGNLYTEPIKPLPSNGGWPSGPDIIYTKPRVDISQLPIDQTTN
jgi:hypothetical protein